MCGIRLQADYGRLEAGRHSIETTLGLSPDATGQWLFSRIWQLGPAGGPYETLPKK
jgi:hypothetical protein